MELLLCVFCRADTFLVSKSKIDHYLQPWKTCVDPSSLRAVYMWMGFYVASIFSATIALQHSCMSITRNDHVVPLPLKSSVKRSPNCTIYSHVRHISIGTHLAHALTEQYLCRGRHESYSDPIIAHEKLANFYTNRKFVHESQAAAGAGWTTKTMMGATLMGLRSGTCESAPQQPWTTCP